MPVSSNVSRMAARASAPGFVAGVQPAAHQQFAFGLRMQWLGHRHCAVGGIHASAGENEFPRQEHVALMPPALQNLGLDNERGCVLRFHRFVEFVMLAIDDLPPDRCHEIPDFLATRSLLGAEIGLDHLRHLADDVRRAVGNNLAIVEYDDAVGEVGHQLHVMFDP
jgi:hypothetical protein